MHSACSLGSMTQGGGGGRVQLGARLVVVLHCSLLISHAPDIPQPAVPFAWWVACTDPVSLQADRGAKLTVWHSKNTHRFE